MPELPEVETVMRGLASRLEGRRIARAELARADLRWKVPQDLAPALSGAHVLGFRRRAKYILMRLAGGRSVLIHLGMSGRMRIGRDAEPAAHEHLVMWTDDGWRIGFIDPRRFGMLDLVATEAEDAHRLLAGLGPEPLGNEFSEAALSAALAGRRTPIKAALLDQRVVAGLGNIYVSEALFRARISPKRIAATVAGARAARLVPAIRETLAEADRGDSRRRAGGAAGAGDPRDARRSHRRRRVEPARLCPAARRARLFQPRLARLRARGRAMPGMSRPARRRTDVRRRAAHRAGRAQHVPLSAVAAIARSRPARRSTT